MKFRFSLVILWILLFPHNGISQDFGPWSYNDVLFTHHPKPWPSIINPSPLQNGRRLDSVHTYKFLNHENGYSLFKSDVCNWITNFDLEVCVTTYFEPPFAGCGTYFRFDPEQSFEIYWRKDSTSYLRKEFDHLNRDSLWEIIHVDQEGLYWLKQWYYNPNGEIQSLVNKSQSYPRMGEFVVDSITYKNTIDESGKVTSIVEEHHSNNPSKDSTVYLYGPNGNLRYVDKYYFQDSIITHDRSEFSYYQDSLEHTVKTHVSEESFNYQVWIVDKGYDSLSRMVYYYDQEPIADEGSFSRQYLIHYDSLGLLREWEYWEGSYEHDLRQHRKLIFFWPSAVYKEEISDWESPLVVYPNPVEHKLNIVLPTVSHEQFEMLIFNISGRIVRYEILPPGQPQYSIDVSGLDKGGYVIRVQTSNNAWVRRFIKANN